MHIPKILYHWRMLDSSTAINPESKPYADTAGLRAVSDYLTTKYQDNLVEITGTAGEYLFTYRAHFAPDPSLKVSIIIPTRDKVTLLASCIKSIFEKSAWQNFEIIIIDNGSEEKETFDYFSHLNESFDNIKVIKADIPFNWSKLNNLGVVESTGDVLVFLNNDTIVISPEWLENLIGYARLPDVGLVGGLLLFEDGTIQHSGVVVGMNGWADHVYHAQACEHYGSPFVSPVLTRNVLAVTGACTAITRKKFESLGGYDEDFIICGSDVELCIRAHKRGLYNVICAEARLYHLESKTRTPHVPENDFVQSKKHYAPYRVDKVDPFYNENLSMNSKVPRVKNDLSIGKCQASCHCF